MITILYMDRMGKWEMFLHGSGAIVSVLSVRHSTSVPHYDNESVGGERTRAEFTESIGAHNEII